MDADEILLQTEERMEGAITALRGDLMTIRTGRASTALVDRITSTTSTPRGQRCTQVLQVTQFQSASVSMPSTTSSSPSSRAISNSRGPADA